MNIRDILYVFLYIEVPAPALIQMFILWPLLPGLLTSHPLFKIQNFTEHESKLQALFS